MKSSKKKNGILQEEVRSLRERTAELEAQLNQMQDEEVKHIHTDQALKQSEQHLRAIIKASPLAIISIDPFGKVLSWNTAAEKMFGWTEAEVLGQQLPIIAEDQKMGFAALLKSYHEEQTPSQVNVKRIRKDGTIISVRLSPAIIRNDQGEVSAIIGILEDITERQHQEEILHQTTQSLQAILDHSPLFIIEMDLEGTYLTVNKAAALLFNQKPENIVGKSIHDLLPEDTASLFMARLGFINETSKPITIEDRLDFPDGERVFLSSLFPLLDADGNIHSIGSIAHDITDRKLAEDKLQQLKDELEIAAAQKAQIIDTLEDTIADRTVELQETIKTLDKNQLAMLYMIEDLNETTAKLETERRRLSQSNEELEAFSYSVSHDLRAPLRHINGYIDLLIKRFPDNLDEKSQHYLDSIAESVDEMGMLIDSLLTFSKTSRQEMHRTTVDMNNIVQEALIILDPDVHARNIDWQINSLPEVSGDRYLLKLVWLNLLSNAAKFTQHESHARVEVGYYEDQDDFIFYVRDNGIGFDMKYSQKLFSVFQRLHNPEEYEGTGVGLANLRRIIQRHDGRAWAESKPGKGAVFYFSLPKWNGKS